MEAAGIEQNPATLESQTGSEFLLYLDASSDAVDDAIVPDLDWIIEAWPALSDSVKSEILKLVRDGVSVSRTS